MSQLQTNSSSAKSLRIILGAGLVFLLLSTTIVLILQHRSLEARCRQEQDIKSIDEELNQAFIKLDFNVLQCRLDDEWVAVGPNGETFRKQTMLSDLRKKGEQNGVKINYSIVVIDREVRFRDNVALVNAHAVIDYGPEKEKARITYLRVYVFNEVWRCISEQGTRIK